MTAPPNIQDTLLRWAKQLQRYRLAAWLVMLLEAATPFQPIGEALFAGGEFLLQPWASSETRLALGALIADDEARARFLHALRAPQGEAFR